MHSCSFASKQHLCIICVAADSHGHLCCSCRCYLLCNSKLHRVAACMQLYSCTTHWQHTAHRSSFAETSGQRLYVEEAKARACCLYRTAQVISDSNSSRVEAAGCEQLKHRHSYRLLLQHAQQGHPMLASTLAYTQVTGSYLHACVSVPLLTSPLPLWLSHHLKTSHCTPCCIPPCVMQRAAPQHHHARSSRSSRQRQRQAHHAAGVH